MSNKLFVLAGPTASGKTGLALQCAQRFDGEIIGADSRQIYRHMVIGTAAPTLEERAQVPHHLVGIVDPDDVYSLAQYQQAAFQTIADIQRRGKLPILVGGTGTYITAVLEGWQIPAAPPDDTLRAELETLTREQLVERLQSLDPDALELVDTLNPRRLIRAIEICVGTGQSFAESRRKSPPNYDMLAFMLTMPRETLYARANSRIDKMLAAGWVNEVRDLLERGYTWDLPAMSALGYPQIGAYLRGESTLEAARELIAHSTHSFIRRQHTWFRQHSDDFHWVEPDSDFEAQIAKWIHRF